LISLLILVGWVWGDEEAKSEKISHVVVGTTESFEEFIEENPFVLVEFYAPWCGHCKSLAPEYEKAATILHDEKSNIVLMKVDATVETKLAETYGVKGYPTIIFFNNGDTKNFDGDRTANSIVSWVKRKSGPPSLLLNSHEEQTKFIEKGGVVVGVFAGEDSKDYITFSKIAKEEEDFNFGHRFDAKEKETIFLVTKDMDIKSFNDQEKVNKKNLKEWIQRDGHPLIAELDQKVWLRSANSKTPLLAVFLDPKSFDTLKPHIKGVAEAHYGKLISSWMDGVTNEQLISRWGGTGNVLPTAFVVTYPTENPKITSWDEETEKELNAESLANFVDKALKGEYSKFQKSEPVPEKNDGPVTIVVGKTFDSIINDPTKDVLIELYAPWCGHCKKLEPIYNELGKKFHGVQSITIAKIDATANAVSDNIQIQGFPTILFFPSNDKDNYISYEGNRELKDLVEFVKEKATLPIEFPKTDL